MSEGYTEVRTFEKLTAFAREGDLSDPQGQTTAFMGVRYLPLWLGSAYLASNLVLNVLNYYWFGKMIQTIRTRFDPPWGTKGVGPEKIHWEPQEKVKQLEHAAQAKVASIANADTEEPLIQRGIDADGHTSVEVTSARRTTRNRRKA